MRALSLLTLELVACVVGCLAGLVPAADETLPFQGLEWLRAGNEPYRVTGVEHDSPASRAGFAPGI